MKFLPVKPVFFVNQMVIPSCFSLVPVFFSCTPALSLQTWDLPRLAVLESNLTVCLKKLHRLSRERGGELCTDSRRSGAQGCLGLSLLYKRRCQLGARRRRSDRWSCLNYSIRSVRRMVEISCTWVSKREKTVRNYICLSAFSLTCEISLSQNVEKQ